MAGIPGRAIGAVGYPSGLWETGARLGGRFRGVQGRICRRCAMRNFVRTRCGLPDTGMLSEIKSGQNTHTIGARE
jgi:hypothetical protein